MNNSEFTTTPYKRFQYTEEALLTALEDIRQERKSLNQASKCYGIPKGTLHNKLRDKVPISRKMGPESTLSAKEEKKIVDWILNKAKLGFPMNPDDVKDSVQKILKAARRPNPFTDDRPGKKWMQLFLQRHPEVVKCRSEMLSKSRASVTEQIIRQWFDGVVVYCREENCLDVLESGKRIFNADETGVQCCPKSGVLLGPKQYKNLYDIAAGNEKESITVLTTFSADGAVAPPMIVFPFKRIPSHITNDMPENWAVGRSDSGWMVSAVFYEYIANVFYPWLLENQVTFPVLFFLDGHKSHISMELSQFCADKKILLYCFPPNATHILQPCDTTIFRPLKNAWRKEVRLHKQQTSKSVTKAVFSKLFKKAFDVAIKSKTIENGFRSCGLFPFDSNAVDYSKCISKRREDILNEQLLNDDNNKPTQEEYMVTKKVMEYEMGSQKAKIFKQALVNNSSSLSSDDYNLFEIWKVCLANCNSLNLHYDSFEERYDLSEERCDLNEERCELTKERSDMAEERSDMAEERCELAETRCELTEERSDLAAERTHDTSLSQFSIDDMPIEIDGIVFDALEFEKAVGNINNEVVHAKIPENNEQDELLTAKDTDTMLVQENENDNCLQKKEISNKIWNEHLHWPKENVDNTKKKVTRKKMPFAISSKKWQDEHRKNEAEKRTKERIKKEKAEEKQRKRKACLTTCKSDNERAPVKKRNELERNELGLNIEDDTSFVSHLNNTNLESIIIDSSSVGVGDYVVVIYDGSQFPGIIVNIKESEYEVNTMAKSGSNFWKWPTTPDQIWYSKEKIKGKISPPSLINARGIYSFSSM